MAAEGKNLHYKAPESLESQFDSSFEIVNNENFERRSHDQSQQNGVENSAGTADGQPAQILVSDSGVVAGNQAASASGQSPANTPTTAGQVFATSEHLMDSGRSLSSRSGAGDSQTPHGAIGRALRPLSESGGDGTAQDAALDMELPAQLTSKVQALAAQNDTLKETLRRTNNLLREKLAEMGEMDLARGQVARLERDSKERLLEIADLRSQQQKGQAMLRELQNELDAERLKNQDLSRRLEAFKHLVSQYSKCFKSLASELATLADASKFGTTFCSEEPSHPLTLRLLSS